MIIVLCLIVIIMIGISPSCGKTDDKIIFTTTFSELSLVQIWDKVLEITDVQNQTAELLYFTIDVNEMGTLELLGFEFHGGNASGKAKSYHVEIPPATGKLQWYSSHSDMSVDINSANHPLGYFEELDKLDFENIDLGDKNFAIEVSFITASIRYSDDHSKLYHLDGGELTPINEISFFKNSTHGTITVSTYGGTQVWWQVWFITSDIGKATTVEYLEIQ